MGRINRPKKRPFIDQTYSAPAYDLCNDCDIPETMCLETDIYSAYTLAPELLFSITSFKLNGVSIAAELNPQDSSTFYGDILDPQILSFPNNTLDNWETLEYFISIDVPVYKYKIIFAMTWKDHTSPQLPNEQYNAWLARTSLRKAVVHESEALCAPPLQQPPQVPMPPQIISGTINRSEIQTNSEEIVKQYFPSGLLGAPDSIDISIRLTSTEVTVCNAANKRCYHRVVYKPNNICKRACRLTSDYDGPNGWGQRVQADSGVCIIATSGLCASISGLWEPKICCDECEPSASPSTLIDHHLAKQCKLRFPYAGDDGRGTFISGIAQECINVTQDKCIAVTGEWQSADCCPKWCVCGSLAVLDGALGFKINITEWEGGPSYGYYTANNLGYPIPEPLGGWPDPLPYSLLPGLPDPAHGLNPNYTQRFAVCDDGKYRIDSLCRYCGLPLIIYFDIGEQSLPEYDVIGCAEPGFFNISILSWEHTTCESGNGHLITYPSITAPTPIPPGSPTSVVVVSGDRQLSVTWVAPVDMGSFPITHYVVEYTNDSVSGVTGITWEDFYHPTQQPPVTSVVIGNLTNDVLYTIRVTAMNFSLGVKAYGAGTPSSSSVLPSPSPSVPPSSPTLVATFNEGPYGTNTYGGSGVHSSLNCVQAGDSIFFDDQYVYQLSMDNAGMVTYEYSIQNVGNFSLFELAGDKLSFKSSSVNITENDIFTITIRASDSANSSSYIDTEVFIPICPAPV